MESVDDDAGVSLYDQPAMGGPANRRKVRMDDITSCTVRDVTHNLGSEGVE